MANCAGCGRYVGGYSAYSLDTPGKPSQPLCYKCKRWAERNPGDTSFPPPSAGRPAAYRRVGAFAKVYIIGSFGVFALGVTVALMTRGTAFGLIIILGAVSLFFFGMSMKKFSGK